MTGERESSTAAQQHSSTECNRQPRRAQSAAGKKGVGAGVGGPEVAASRGAGAGAGVGEGVGVGVTPLEGDALRVSKHRLHIDIDRAVGHKSQP